MLLDLDAIILAGDPLANVKVAGLTARERAVRVARKVGATRVLVVDEDRGNIASWRGDRRVPLLVIRADQLVHTPLVQPLVDALPGDAIAVTVEGSPPEYAGAFIATAERADAAVRALARGDSDRVIADAMDAASIPHGAIARHSLATPADRRAAHRLLYRILVKPQDNAITRYVYRPVSFPLTRLLAWTPITPNQISYVVAALVAIGCWVTAHESFDMAILGTAIVLAASYLDCCDGEIARIKLLSSRYGAWIDTVVDELSSVGYMIAIGWHCHLHFGPSYFGNLGFDPWTATIALGVITYGVSMYCIYYNIIVGVGSANSQDYAGSFEVVPGDRPGSVRLRPAATQAIPARELPPLLRFIATYAPYVVRRDFISWCALVFAVTHVTHVSFGMLSVGGVITVVIVVVDHVKLRRLRRRIAHDGLVLEAP
jgi:phosphatidylglycerophosphate synthase